MFFIYPAELQWLHWWDTPGLLPCSKTLTHKCQIKNVHHFIEPSLIDHPGVFHTYHQSQTKKGESQGGLQTWSHVTYLTERVFVVQIYERKQTVHSWQASRKPVMYKNSPSLPQTELAPYSAPCTGSTTTWSWPSTGELPLSPAKETWWLGALVPYWPLDTTFIP